MKGHKIGSTTLVNFKLYNSMKKKKMSYMNLCMMFY